MPRTVRPLSEYSIYHIVIKGNNSQQIFFDEYDYQNFLNTLKVSCKNYNIIIIAYCLMNNHIHLLLKAEENNIPFMFKAFGASFVYKYNKKYNRTGGLFIGRYYSKAINDEQYFSTVIKYIHYNPVRAGICKRLYEYKWSSYNSYKCLADGGNENDAMYIDTEYLFTILDMKEFDMVHIESDDDLFNFFMIDYGVNKGNPDSLLSVTEKLLEQYSVEDVAGKLFELGVSRLKISKLLGIDRRKLKLQ